MGRYVTEDLIGFDGGVNFFAYVDGNPLIFIDPRGLEITGGWSGGTLPYFPTRVQHCFRNKHNICPLTKPEINKIYYTCSKYPRSTWSTIGDGKLRDNFGNECAYDKNGLLLPDENANYTYNYTADPWTFSHVWQDWLPHYWYGSCYIPNLTHHSD
jgi:hypothetical protein